MKQAAIGAFSQELLAAPALALPLARGVDFQGTVCDLVRQSQSGVVHVLCVQFRGKGGGGYDMAFLVPVRGGGVEWRGCCLSTDSRWRWPSPVAWSAGKSGGPVPQGSGPLPLKGLQDSGARGCARCSSRGQGATRHSCPWIDHGCRAHAHGTAPPHPPVCVRAHYSQRLTVLTSTCLRSSRLWARGTRPLACRALRGPDPRCRTRYGRRCPMRTRLGHIRQEDPGRPLPPPEGTLRYCPWAQDRAAQKCSKKIGSSVA